MVRGALGTALGFLLAASCAGRSIDRAQDSADTGGTRSQRSTGGTQGSPTSPGAGGTIGSAPVAAASGGMGTSAGASTGMGGGSTVGGAAPSAGRTAGSGATPGSAARGGNASAGGRHGMVSTAGEAGAPQAGPDGGTGEGGHGSGVTCTDEFTKALFGARCSDAEAYAQGPTFELVAGATEIDECLDACRARPDCRAVTAYFEGDWPAVCSLTHEGCDEPFKPDWSEENGGRTQRKSCDSEGCSYEPLGLFRCAEDEERLTGATSLGDCIAACDADETCTGVVDYFYLEDVFGRCFMSVGSCSAEVVNAEEGTFYRRDCD